MEGKANAHLLAFLGKAFGVAKSLVSLESGELNRQKRVRIRRPTRLPEELGIAARPACPCLLYHTYAADDTT